MNANTVIYIQSGNEVVVDDLDKRGYNTLTEGRSLVIEEGASLTFTDEGNSTFVNNNVGKNIGSATGEGIDPEDFKLSVSGYGYQTESVNDTLIYDEIKPKNEETDYWIPFKSTVYLVDEDDEPVETYVYNDAKVVNPSKADKTLTQPTEMVTEYTAINQVTLTSPERNYYTFVGWTAEERTNGYYMVGYYMVAHFVPDSWELTWELNTTANDAITLPESYNYGTGIAEADMPQPTWTNHTFMGWYDNEELSGDPVVSVTETDTEDKTFYAKWVENPTTTDLDIMATISYYQESTRLVVPVTDRVASTTVQVYQYNPLTRNTAKYTSQKLSFDETEVNSGGATSASGSLTLSVPMYAGDYEGLYTYYVTVAQANYDSSYAYATAADLAAGADLSYSATASLQQPYVADYYETDTAALYAVQLDLKDSAVVIVPEQTTLTGTVYFESEGDDKTDADELNQTTVYLYRKATGSSEWEYIGYSDVVGTTDEESGEVSGPYSFAYDEKRTDLSVGGLTSVPLYNTGYEYRIGVNKEYYDTTYYQKGEKRATCKNNTGVVSIKGMAWTANVLLTFDKEDKEGWDDSEVELSVKVNASGIAKDYRPEVNVYLVTDSDLSTKQAVETDVDGEAAVIDLSDGTTGVYTSDPQTVDASDEEKNTTFQVLVESTTEGYESVSTVVTWNRYMRCFLYSVNGRLYTSTSGSVVATLSPATYNIRYYSGSKLLGDLEPSTYTYSYGAILPTPVQDGCDFAGWYTTSSYTGDPVTKISEDTTGDLRFYAKWTPKTYTITYQNYDGSSYIEDETHYPTSYIYGKGAKIYDVSMDGYIFRGWYTDPTDFDTKVTEITKTDFGNKTLYAVWYEMKLSTTINSDVNTAKGERTDILKLLTGEEKDDTITYTVTIVDKNPGALDEPIYQYQWYKSTDGGETWTKQSWLRKSTEMTDSLTLTKRTIANSGEMYYCQVQMVDEEGTVYATLESDVRTLEVQQTVTIKGSIDLFHMDDDADVQNDAADRSKVVIKVQKSIDDGETWSEEGQFTQVGSESTLRDEETGEAIVNETTGETALTSTVNYNWNTETSDANAIYRIQIDKESYDTTYADLVYDEENLIYTLDAQLQYKANSFMLQVDIDAGEVSKEAYRPKAVDLEIYQATKSDLSDAVLYSQAHATLNKLGIAEAYLNVLARYTVTSDDDESEESLPYYYTAKIVSLGGMTYETTIGGETQILGDYEDAVSFYLDEDNLSVISYVDEDHDTVYEADGTTPASYVTAESGAANAIILATIQDENYTVNLKAVDDNGSVTTLRVLTSRKSFPTEEELQSALAYLEKISDSGKTYSGKWYFADTNGEISNNEVTVDDHMGQWILDADGVIDSLAGYVEADAKSFTIFTRVIDATDVDGALELDTTWTDSDEKTYNLSGDDLPQQIYVELLYRVSGSSAEWEVAPTSATNIAGAQLIEPDYSSMGSGSRMIVELDFGKRPVKSDDGETYEYAIRVWPLNEFAQSYCTTLSEANRFSDWDNANTTPTAGDYYCAMHYDPETMSLDWWFDMLDIDPQYWGMFGSSTDVETEEIVVAEDATYEDYLQQLIDDAVNEELCPSDDLEESGHDHSWGDYSVDSLTGKVTYTCTKCGKKFSYTEDDLKEWGVEIKKGSSGGSGDDSGSSSSDGDSDSGSGSGRGSSDGGSDGGSGSGSGSSGGSSDGGSGDEDDLDDDDSKDDADIEDDDDPDDDGGSDSGDEGGSGSGSSGGSADGDSDDGDSDSDDDDDSDSDGGNSGSTDKYEYILADIEDIFNAYLQNVREKAEEEIMSDSECAESEDGRHNWCGLDDDGCGEQHLKDHVTWTSTNEDGTQKGFVTYHCLNDGCDATYIAEAHTEITTSKLYEISLQLQSASSTGYRSVSNQNVVVAYISEKTGQIIMTMDAESEDEDDQERWEELKSKLEASTKNTDKASNVDQNEDQMIQFTDVWKYKVSNSFSDYLDYVRQQLEAEAADSGSGDNPDSDGGDSDDSEDDGSGSGDGGSSGSGSGDGDSSADGDSDSDDTDTDEAIVITDAMVLENATYEGYMEWLSSEFEAEPYEYTLHIVKDVSGTNVSTKGIAEVSGRAYYSDEEDAVITSFLQNTLGTSLSDEVSGTSTGLVTSKLVYGVFNVNFWANNDDATVNGSESYTVTRKFTTAYSSFPTAVRNGYTFLGWFDDPEGGNRVTSVGATEYGDIDLFAHWEERKPNGDNGGSQNSGGGHGGSGDGDGTDDGPTWDELFGAFVKDKEAEGLEDGLEDDGSIEFITADTNGSGSHGSGRGSGSGSGDGSDQDGEGEGLEDVSGNDDVSGNSDISGNSGISDNDAGGHDDDQKVEKDSIFATHGCRWHWIILLIGVIQLVICVIVKWKNDRGQLLRTYVLCKYFLPLIAIILMLLIAIFPGHCIWDWIATALGSVVALVCYPIKQKVLEKREDPEEDANWK